MNALELRNVTKKFTSAGIPAVDDISFTLHIKGQLAASPGHFTPPEKRGIGMVFQDHALFPHLTVFENVKFGLKGQPAAIARETTLGMLKLVGLENFGERYPH